MKPTMQNMLTEKELQEGLLGYNFFPRVAKYQDEFPPCFVSTCLCEDDFKAYKALVNAGDRLNHERQKSGFGVIHANSIRSDYSPRLTEIPHPLAYCNLCKKLIDHYDEWTEIQNNPKSAIRVGKDNKGDKRVFIMRPRAKLEVPVNARYLVKTDIAKFYDSIYTHAIAWAIMGIKEAKQNRGMGEGANEIDAALRRTRRNETNGISIGPGSSSICGEIMLKAVDDSSTMQKYQYLHFIDDFHFYAVSEDEAERFILDLTEVLARYKLTINQRKTQVIPLPEVQTVDWLRTISAASSIGLNWKTISNFLDLALQIQKQYPESSALRTALITIEGQWDSLDNSAKKTTVHRLFNIAFFYPAAVKSLCRILLNNSAVKNNDDVTANLDKLCDLIIQHSKLDHSDAVTWLLYTILHEGQAVSEDAVDAIIESKDSLALALLTETRSHKVRSKLVAFIASFEDLNPEPYERDEYWLLYYELFSKGGVPLKDLNKQVGKYEEEFHSLIKMGCKFIDTEIDSRLIKPGSSRLTKPGSSRLIKPGSSHAPILNRIPFLYTATNIVNNLPYAD